MSSKGIAPIIIILILIIVLVIGVIVLYRSNILIQHPFPTTSTTTLQTSTQSGTPSAGISILLDNYDLYIWNSVHATANISSRTPGNGTFNYVAPNGSIYQTNFTMTKYFFDYYPNVTSFEQQSGYTFYQDGLWQIYVEYNGMKSQTISIQVKNRQSTIIQGVVTVVAAGSRSETWGITLDNGTYVSFEGFASTSDLNNFKSYLGKRISANVSEVLHEFSGCVYPINCVPIIFSFYEIPSGGGSNPITSTTTTTTTSISWSPECVYGSSPIYYGNYLISALSGNPWNVNIQVNNSGTTVDSFTVGPKSAFSVASKDSNVAGLTVWVTAIRTLAGGGDFVGADLIAGPKGNSCPFSYCAYGTAYPTVPFYFNSYSIYPTGGVDNTWTSMKIEDSGNHTVDQVVINQGSSMTTKAQWYSNEGNSYYNVSIRLEKARVVGGDVVSTDISVGPAGFTCPVYPSCIYGTTQVSYGSYNITAANGNPWSLNIEIRNPQGNMVDSFIIDKKTQNNVVSRDSSSTGLTVWVTNIRTLAGGGDYVGADLIVGPTGSYCPALVH